MYDMYSYALKWKVLNCFWIKLLNFSYAYVFFFAKKQFKFYSVRSVECDSLPVDRENRPENKDHGKWSSDSFQWFLIYSLIHILALLKSGSNICQSFSLRVFLFFSSFLEPEKKPSKVTVLLKPLPLHDDSCKFLSCDLTREKSIGSFTRSTNYIDISVQYKIISSMQ